MDVAAAGNAAPTIAPASVLPRGVSLTAMRRAIEEFRQIVGQDNLSVTSEKIAPYAKMYIPAPDANHLPVGALAPNVTPPGGSRVVTTPTVAPRY